MLVRRRRRHGVFVIIAFPVAFADEALTTEIADDLAVVEAALREANFGGDEMFTEVSRHLMEAGGKRFRAMLVLLAARFRDRRGQAPASSPRPACPRPPPPPFPPPPPRRP